MKRYHSVNSSRIRERRRRQHEEYCKQSQWYPDWTNNWNNKSPFDCGRSRCHVCHYGKFYYETSEEEVAMLDENEQILEFFILGNDES